MKLVEDYIEKAYKYINNYGKRTILLMQVGTFYEIYSLNQNKCENILYEIIYDISDITGLAVVERSINVCNKETNWEKIPIIAAGFHINYIDKWLHKIQMGGYTCVLYSQDNNCKNTTRSLTGVYSPGIYISDESTNNNNNMCIWIENINNKMHIGISNINIITGKSCLFEYIINNSNTPNIYDDIERYISVYNPCETTIITNLSTNTVNSIIQYTNIKSIRTTIIDLNDNENLNTIKAKKCEQQKYKILIFTTFFNIKNINVYLEKFNLCEIATQSYCYLINHLNGLNPNLTTTIEEPIVENLTNKLILANHSSKQLNILDDDNNYKYSSVLNLTNNTLTSMGKRNYREQLLNPITNIDNLQNMYNITENVLKEDNMYSLLRDNIKNIHDIEKNTRLIILKTTNIKNIYNLFYDLIEIKKICKLVEKYDWLTQLDPITIEELCNSIILFIETYINIYNIDIKTGDQELELFNKNVYSDLDIINENYNDSNDKLKEIVNVLNGLLNDKQNKPKGTSQHVKLNQTEKSGYTIQTTKTRIPNLQKIIQENESFSGEFISTFSNTKKMFDFNNKISIQKINSTSNYSICSDEINDLCKKEIELKATLKNVIQEKFNDFITLLSTSYTEQLYKISRFIIDIDLIQNRAYTAKKYNYCKPEIFNSENSSLEAKLLRHPLIEEINNEELYVANDITLDSHNNILLFGTNAVGKTSLIKSIGISIILAQSGMYVPANFFKFSPYKSLFTRILNCDNLFKGLSTFTLEMSEMSNILKYSNKNSLVLGDELCSGTELPSAISIFVAGLQNLSKKKVNFIFATHFHEMLELCELNEITNINYKHMTVKYDNSKKCIIYDRKIKDGSGEKIYGLEVCKSLHLPEDFMNDAFTILHKYYLIDKDILSYDTSRYNQEKIKTKICELCKEKTSSHVHHLSYQKDAVDNWINNTNYVFNKNHSANLIDICEDCHNDLHKKNIRMIKRNTTSGIVLENI